MTDCPNIPKSESKRELGFVRRPMVRWFNPGQLVITGMKAVLSAIFGVYADKREIQAALHKAEDPYDYSDREDLWLDYTADLGDGFESTYSLATLLADEKLVCIDEDKQIETERGKILILGGDQVYPTATREEYRNRFAGPYKAALPWVHSDEPPHLYAVPGNHDWYDGLTAFTRLFLQERWIGGWKTRQERSYFALKLPHNWWLFAIDIQLESHIDDPQIKYFGDIAEKHFKKGDKVILCTAQPDWVREDGFKNLSYFEKKIIRKHGGQLKLTLSGDLHHYCRYESEDGTRHKITAGGGGAYLYPTHNMPEELSLEVKDVKDEVEVEKYTQKQVFPDKKKSRWLTFGALLLPFRTRSFSALLGGLYLIYAWIIQSASIAQGNSFSKMIQKQPFNLDGLYAVFKNFISILVRSPGAIVFSLVIVFGLWGFCSVDNWAESKEPKESRKSNKRKKSRVRLIGVVHGLAHVFLIVMLAWLFAIMNLHIFNLEAGSFFHVITFAVEVFIFGGILGGLLFGIYLSFGSLWLKVNMNEAFSCQAIEDYKNFLRLHIDATGKITVYPVGVEKVCKKWRLNKSGEAGDRWFLPEDGHEMETRLIEEPIVVDSH